MRWFPRAVIVASTATVMAGAAPSEAQQDPRQNPPTNSAISGPAPPRVAAKPEAYEGVWDYNPRESVNAANGRPEQGPQSATQRRNNPINSGSATPSRPPQAPMPGPGGYGGYGPGGGGGMGGGGYGMPSGRGGAPAINTFVLRDLARDLLEVPEALTIRVTAETVTFVDDLDREHTYFTNGKKQKFQIGAAVFDAKTTWQDGQLKKQITAAEGFKMAETYFLSEDGQRLFVIIRIGEPRKDAPVQGVNRVYDRVG